MSSIISHLWAFFCFFLRKEIKTFIMKNIKIQFFYFEFPVSWEIFIYLFICGQSESGKRSKLCCSQWLSIKNCSFMKINIINYRRKGERAKNETNHVKTIKSMLSTAIQYNNFHGAITFLIIINRHSLFLIFVHFPWTIKTQKQKCEREKWFFRLHDPA